MRIFLVEVWAVGGERRQASFQASPVDSKGLKQDSSLQKYHYY